MSLAEESNMTEGVGLSPAVETKIKMSLSEASMENLDIKLLSLGSRPGLLSPLLLAWVSQSGGKHTGKLLTFFQDPGVSGVFEGHPKHSFNLLDESIKIQDFKEILVIGQSVAIFDANGQIFIQRGKEFIDAANRVIRSLSKITALIEAKKK